MRPQYIVILLKASNMPAEWQYRDLATALQMSVSEISESLQRSHVAGFVEESKRKVSRENLMEFLEHGLHHVFPAVPGTLVTGTPTAHSHPEFNSRFQAEYAYVWPDEDGSERELPYHLFRNPARQQYGLMRGYTSYLLLLMFFVSAGPGK